MLPNDTAWGGDIRQSAGKPREPRVNPPINERIKEKSVVARGVNNVKDRVSAEGGRE